MKVTCLLLTLLTASAANLRRNLIEETTTQAPTPSPSNENVTTSSPPSIVSSSLPLKSIGADFKGKPSSGDYSYCDKSKDPIVWPLNDGCLHDPIPLTIQVGSILDRFGGTGGFFMSPLGFSYTERSLPYILSDPTCVNYYNEVYNLNNPDENYHMYKVQKEFTVLTCHAAPFFGAPGGAIQYKTSNPIYQLISDKIISEVNVQHFPKFIQ